MGFRNGSYMTCWNVEPGRSGKYTQVRLSHSKKNKLTGEFEQDFSGYCTFLGKANEMAKDLQPQDRIKIISCDVDRTYNREKQKEYFDCKVFEFEVVDKNTTSNSAVGTVRPVKATSRTVDDGEPDDDLPF